MLSDPYPILTLVTLVEFILVAGRVIKCLTTSMASSLPGNWTSCSYKRKSECCLVSKQKNLDKLTLNNSKVASALILSGTLFHSFGPLTIK